MNKLTITRGIPGSGKSTWALEEVKHYGGFAISRDELRYSLYGKGSGLKDSEEKQVTNTEQDLVKLHLKYQNVFVHDTNLPDKVCRGWRDLAVEAKAEFKIKDFRDVPLETCLHRNQRRFRSVPEEIIKSMYDRQVKNRNLAAPLVEVFSIKKELEQYIPDTSKPKAWIFDIDGTLANGLNHRSPYDTSLYHLDVAFQEVVNVARALNGAGYLIVYTTGRDSDYREVTRNWLNENVGRFGDLVMRHSKDVRNDAVVKLELLFEEIAPFYNILAAFDDRPRVCRAWRSAGIPVFQMGDPYFEF